MQTDLRDEKLTLASEIRMIGIVKENYENVMIRDILEEGVVVSTYNPRLAFELSLKPIKELGFTGLIKRDLLVGMYEERDYLWNPNLGMYSTFCKAVGNDSDNSWFVNKDRMTQFSIKKDIALRYPFLYYLAKSNIILLLLLINLVIASGCKGAC